MKLSMNKENFYEQSSSQHTVVSHFWHMKDTESGEYPLYASTQWAIVFSQNKGIHRVQLIGPRLIPTSAPYDSGEYFIGIVFQGGALLCGRAKSEQLNQIDNLDVVKDSFVIQSEVFAIPTFDTLDTLVDQLLKKEIISTAPIAAVSHRDKQRKLKKYIGLSPKQIEQANRVEDAITLLSEHESISAVAIKVGFADQAHMTREFKRLVGMTPLGVAEYFR